ncbi:uncharacterized protein LOC103311663, partial [Acyrthosiphon pisum]|uniref:Uncharacterized protein n=1 Tax=Acyrthosiphon pisum TaxID=7029 RepID=A0A8R2D7I5_ACYPI
MPDIKHLRVFGTVVYTHIPKQKRKKWDPKSEKDKLEFTDTPTQIKDDPVKVESTMVDNRSGMVLRDRNTLKAPIRYNVSSFIANCNQPLNRDEAISAPHKNELEDAMHDEITSLHENNTWSLVNLPQGKVAL